MSSVICSRNTPALHTTIAIVESIAFSLKDKVRHSCTSSLEIGSSRNSPIGIQIMLVIKKSHAMVEPSELALAHPPQKSMTTANLRASKSGSE